VEILFNLLEKKFRNDNIFKKFIHSKHYYEPPFWFGVFSLPYCEAREGGEGPRQIAYCVERGVQCT